MSALQGCWLSFDLGLKGDYQGMYKYLDSFGAIECGINMAFMKREITLGFKEQIIQEIKENVRISPTDRVYLIYRKPNDHNTCGYFILGGRRPADWKGYSVPPSPDSADSD